MHFTRAPGTVLAAGSTKYNVVAAHLQVLSIVECHFLSLSLHESSNQAPAPTLQKKKTLDTSVHPHCHSSVIRIGTGELQMESEQDTAQEGWQSCAWWSRRVRGSREEKEGSRERGMMSLWVILLTGYHAVLIAVIGFPQEQERPGTPPGVFIGFYFKGQQLACALRIDWLF